jgi:2-oxo-hept-3-ene-1,7-dioate hydratase
MLSESIVAQLAQALEHAQASRTPLEQFSKAHPGMTLEDGYRVNRAWAAIRRARGERVIGHKIGLTSRAMQQSSQIDEPDFGVLFERMRYVATSGEVLQIPVADFISPRVEVELAFVLKRDLVGPNADLQQVLDATEYVTPAIEIIDARIEQFCRQDKRPRRVQDTISDNAASAGIVIGAAQLAPHGVNLPWVGAVLKQNGVVEETGLAAGVMGHPALGVAWLSNKLAPWGEGLAAGEIVLAGSFTRPCVAQRGDVFEADYGALGRIEFRFV